MQNNKRRGIFDIWSGSNSRLRIAGVILVILAVGSTLQIVWTNQVRKDLVECQMSFMNMTVDTIEKRSKTTAQASDALESLISGLKDAPNGESTQRLYNEYLDARNEQRKVQASSQYPSFTVEDMCQP